MKLRSVLIIDDDADLRPLLEKHVRELNCDVVSVGTAQEALQRCAESEFDLVILDLSLPDMNGLDVCALIKREHKRTLILMLTARSSEVDRVVGLELGGDDYVCKPFSFRELQARIKALFRRNDESGALPAEASLPLIRGRLIIDPSKRSVCISGQLIELTAKEFDLLFYLAEHPGHVFSRLKLLNAVWGPSYAGYEHTVNSHVNRLRAKIEKDPARPELVHTVRGAGYRFSEIPE